MSIIGHAPIPLKPPRDQALGTPVGRAGWLMGWLGYERDVIDLVLDLWREQGSLQGLDALDVGDRPFVVELLQGNPKSTAPATSPMRKGLRRPA